ncbi:unnamed protein product [Orchesella dallaii]|uniref:DUF4789 domain-containing protein n=1 Tax=Orchesella dallaii TaxID=48710 RepID=A0ABP1Q3W4_9HEXA
MARVNWLPSVYYCHLHLFIVGLCALSVISGVTGAALNSPEAKAALKVKKDLCPELESQSSYTIWATRYDNRTSKCYKTGQVGPCGKNMIFYSLPNDQTYGECDCNYDIECKSLIYSNVYDQCFYAYEQGHCDDGYWLVADASGLPSCERNLCRPPPKYSLKYEWALYKGRCERLYKPLHDCRPDEYLWIPKGQRFPQCGKVECNNPHSFVPELQCELGSKLYYEGRCVRRKGI